ncbi:YceI family protein [Aestuariibaculum suncheonense]|uniref:YceI family protein n=1 Tax=Aestuariibaculum suncheonense TaxID=1028745 RepID=A0A8J6Q6N2_9FLAO|nr:YceI family protein [Aestuariibaculum suncheonense]MBD0834670.1 YceI family protein [Aestuariibaculum suncheonense]
MKYLLYCIAFISLNAFAQEKYLTKTGTVSFEASVPSFEEVKATNQSVTAILNSENGEFAALVLVNGFRFKNALMEEHFNENYAESDTYPKATFKGVIDDFNFSDIKQNTALTISGELNFHGKTKILKSIPVKTVKTNETIEISGTFKAYASDFDIKIPKIVSNKIAETIDVSFDFKLSKK